MRPLTLAPAMAKSLAGALTLSATLFAGCAGVETQPADTAEFESRQFRYYQWRTPPLENTSNSRDSVYVLDGMVRESVDARLSALGYTLDPERAQFDVHFVNAPGSLQGFASEEATNINTRPQLINRQVDQATIDNAQALSGVRDTENIRLSFNDVETRQEVWSVVITKIVEDANMADTARLRRVVNQAINRGLSTLPAAP